MQLQSALPAGPCYILHELADKDLSDLADTIKYERLC